MQQMRPQMAQGELHVAVIAFAFAGNLDRKATILKTHRRVFCTFCIQYTSLPGVSKNDLSLGGRVALCVALWVARVAVVTVATRSHFFLGGHHCGTLK